MKYSIIISSFVLSFFCNCSLRNGPEIDVIQNCQNKDKMTAKTELLDCAYQVVAESDRELEYYFVSQEMADALVSMLFSDKSISNRLVISQDDVIVYCYNLERGWVIISSDTRTQPVLAYNESNFIDEISLQEGPMAGWLNLTCAEIASLKRYNPDLKNDYTIFWDSFKKNITIYKFDNGEEYQTKGEPGNQHYVWGRILMDRTLWSDVVVSDIGHLIQTKWGQEQPWNISMPYVENTTTHLKTGCVAIALSQILYYSHNRTGFPAHLYEDISIASTTYSYDYLATGSAIITVDRGDQTNPSLNWAQMAQDSTSIGDPNRFKYVSDLMLDLGERVDMVYFFALGEPTESGVIASNVIINSISALSDYGFSASSSTYSLTTVLSELSSQRPIFISDNMHAWIIDGYRERNVCYRNTYYWFKIYDSSLWEQCDVIDEEPTSVHNEGDLDYEFEYLTLRHLKMNWGEDGMMDDTFVSIGSSGHWMIDLHTSFTANIIYSIVPHN